jgi:Uma2 family endonuclease
VPRITYLEGELELMSPGFNHESIASLIGRLVEVYCVDRDIEILPVGSWTIKKRRKKRAAEPDECYVFGVHEGEPRSKRPDLAIEVIWTSGGIDKLDVYRKLNVPEVWIWDNGAIQIYRLRGEAYHAVAQSKLLPDLDVALLCSFLDRPTLNRAIRDFRAALAARAT